MKVSKLIKLLQEYDDGVEVHLAYNYGDRSNTRVAPKLRDVDLTTVRHSDYFSMCIVDDEYSEDDGKSVVVLI